MRFTDASTQLPSLCLFRKKKRDFSLDHQAFVGKADQLEEISQVIMDQEHSLLCNLGATTRIQVLFTAQVHSCWASPQQTRQRDVYPGLGAFLGTACSELYPNHPTPPASHAEHN